jgi:hypothetical protein
VVDRREEISDLVALMRAQRERSTGGATRGMVLPFPPSSSALRANILSTSVSREMVWDDIYVEKEQQLRK